MTEQAKPAVPSRTKPCDGCGNRVTLQERRMDTGLCLPCNETAVNFFGIPEQQAGTAVLIKKIIRHFTTGSLNYDSKPIRHRVRALVLASMGTIPNATEDEKADAAILRYRYPAWVKNQMPIEPEPQTDFLEGMP